MKENLLILMKNILKAYYSYKQQKIVLNRKGLMISMTYN